MGLLAGQIRRRWGRARRREGSGQGLQHWRWKMRVEPLPNFFLATCTCIFWSGEWRSCGVTCQSNILAASCIADFGVVAQLKLRVCDDMNASILPRYIHGVWALHVFPMIRHISELLESGCCPFVCSGFAVFSWQWGVTDASRAEKPHRQRAHRSCSLCLGCLSGRVENGKGRFGSGSSRCRHPNVRDPEVVGDRCKPSSA